MVIAEEIDNALRIRLLPNRSATWKQTFRVLIGICSLSLVVAILWAIQGAWLVLPFAGLEVALLFYFVWRVCFRTYQQEILNIGPDVIRVERGSTYPTWIMSFRRHHSEFVITNPRHSLSPAAISLNSPECNLRVGQFLNMEDSWELLDVIRTSGVRYRVTGRTLIHAIEGFDP